MVPWRNLFSISKKGTFLGKIYHNILFYPSTSHYLKQELKNCNSILDLGCGNNSILRFIPEKKYSIGIDIFWGSLQESRFKKIHGEYIQGDICTLSLKSKSVDAIVIFEVIEHLEKRDFLTLNHELKRIARRKIILSTPNGFVHQDEYEDNPHQKHKSGWNISELKELGFSNFRGVGGLRCLGIKYKSQLLFLIIQSIPQKISYFHPKYTNGILATTYIEDVNEDTISP